MKKLNLKNRENQKTNCFGMPLATNQELFLKRRLDELKEKCPSYAKLELKFEKRKSCIKGQLTVNSFSEKFISTKVASESIQTFLLLEEDIESQLLEWKRNRFSKSLFNNLSKEKSFTEICA